MKTLFQVIILGLISTVTSCNGTSSETKNQTEQATQTIQNQQDTAKLEQVAAKTVFATYQQATVYTGRTDYLFEDEIGGMLMVEYSNFDEIPPIELTENMLESDEELEGPPGANPELIGKKFKISYNEDGNVYKIELAEN